jgi:hypothetical protein
MIDEKFLDNIYTDGAPYSFKRGEIPTGRKARKLEYATRPTISGVDLSQAALDEFLANGGTVTQCTMGDTKFESSLRRYNDNKSDKKGEGCE